MAFDGVPERTAVLVVRAWLEGHPPRVVARITYTLDVARPDEVVLAVGSREEVAAGVDRWLEELERRAAEGECSAGAGGAQRGRLAVPPRTRRRRAISVNLTAQLQTEYDRLWQTCQVRPERRATAAALADRIVQNRARYEAAGKPHGVPWYVVGIIHQLESNGNFQTHLHNGDPLTARTVRVPAGRPATGNPPFRWETSAADALVDARLNTWTDWSPAGTLFVLERYNGFGYRKPEIAINSPYLWSFSTHYTKGKFIRDREYSPTAVSGQCGAAVLLQTLAERGLVPSAAGAEILKRGSKGPAVSALKRQLRAWFEANEPGRWAGFRVAANDVFGANLEKAVKAFQARKGLAQDGEVGKKTRDALAAG